MWWPVKSQMNVLIFCRLKIYKTSILSTVFQVIKWPGVKQIMWRLVKSQTKILIFWWLGFLPGTFGPCDREPSQDILNLFWIHRPRTETTKKRDTKYSKLLFPFLSSNTSPRAQHTPWLLSRPIMACMSALLESSSSSSRTLKMSCRTSRAFATQQNLTSTADKSPPVYRDACARNQSLTRCGRREYPTTCVLGRVWDERGWPARSVPLHCNSPCTACSG